MTEPSGSLHSPGRLLDCQPKRKRFGEPQKFVPVAFVVCTISSLYSIYVFCHCVPLLHSGDPQSRGRAFWQMLAFHYVTAMLVICYVRSILQHPGEIPDNDPNWEYLAHDARPAQEFQNISLQEMKRTGERRHCKWCGKYKPDRCHHCRVCKTCILKMDHHCPWIYNCVGFGNYKFFFLLLFYSLLACHFMVWTMIESVKRVINDPSTPFSTMFYIFFGETLSFFLAVLVSMFFCFHIWLMLKAMTTIEFCEKALPKKEGEAKSSYDNSVYDLGWFGNVEAVLGTDCFLWFFPVDTPQEGNGLSFISDKTRLKKDMETGASVRLKTHQPAPRIQRRTHLWADENISSYVRTNYGLDSNPNAQR